MKQFMQVQKFQEQGILLPVNHDFKIEVKSSFEQKDNVLKIRKQHSWHNSKPWIGKDKEDSPADPGDLPHYPTDCLNLMRPVMNRNNKIIRMMFNIWMK
jgi:hypothetical protein